MSAAQTFKLARMRRGRPKDAAGIENNAGTFGATNGDSKPSNFFVDQQVALPAAGPVTQPLVVAGLAPNEARTMTAIAGASVGPLSITQRAAQVAAAAGAALFLERRSRPRNGRKVRALNLVIAAVLLVVFSPLMLLIALLVRLTSKGPIIYKQVRVGRDRRHYNVLAPADRRSADRRRDRNRRFVRSASGQLARERARQTDEERRAYASAVAVERRSSDRRGAFAGDSEARRKRIANAVHDRRTWNTCGQTFTMYKFRTMSVDAEAGGGAMWAQKNDPRVTPIGGFLRKTRLDELPQLINVLKGDMNIVGPRPERPTIVPQLVQNIAYYPIRQRTRPGITGLAQIRAGYDTTVDDVKNKVRYDLEYLRRRSVIQDLRIMVRTPLVMFFKRTGH